MGILTGLEINQQIKRTGFIMEYCNIKICFSHLKSKKFPFLIGEAYNMIIIF